ncbi:MAG: MAPEG family protein, partial [Pseudomonadota bacterium]
MSPTEIALLGLVCWSIALTAMIGLFRLGLVATSGRASNTFKASGEDTPGFGQRLARAHANCY